MMTKFTEHCDEKTMDNCDEERHGALWWQVLWNIIITTVWSIVMTEVMEHFDFIVMTIEWSIMMMVMVHCDARFHGALRGKGSWSIVIRRIWEHCDDNDMEHCDAKCHGALWWQVLELFDAKGMLQCDEKGREHFDDRVMQQFDKKCNGTFWWQGLENTVMSGVMELWDEKRHRAFWWQVSWNFVMIRGCSIVMTGSWNIVITGVRVYCDD